MTVDEIMREAMTLDVETRTSIAHELLSSLESLSEAEVERRGSRRLSVAARM